MAMSTIKAINRADAEAFGRAGRPSSWKAYVRRLVRMVKSLATLLDYLYERRRSRLALLEMTDEQLKDIGISRCDAHREGLRAFWD